MFKENLNENDTDEVFDSLMNILDHEHQDILDEKFCNAEVWAKSPREQIVDMLRFVLAGADNDSRLI